MILFVQFIKRPFLWDKIDNEQVTVTVVLTEAPSEAHSPACLDLLSW